jgi:hypothetical protein
MEIERIDDNFAMEEKYDIPSRKLEEKFNIRFYNLCDLFETCLKGKTKSKITYQYLLNKIEFLVNSSKNILKTVLMFTQF